MKILHVWDADYPWDIRVEKISKALLEGGHDVHIAARNRGGNAEYELCDGLHVHRMRHFRTLNELKGFPVFLNPYWIRHLRRLVVRLKPKLILVRDLPLAQAALRLGTRFHIPVILDMAECYPEMLKNLARFGGRRPHDFLVRNPFLASVVEKYVVRRVDHVFAMIEESQNRLIELGVPADRVSIVSNTPSLGRFEYADSDGAAVDPSNEAVFVTYIGVLDYSRGLDTAIRGFALFLKSSPSSKFDIYGDGRALSQLKALIDELGVGDGVILHGWVNNEELPEIMRRADIGIVPHYRCGHWDNTIPNKLFDYMASGRPVVVSDPPPTARIVKQVNCGLVYESGSPSDLAAVLTELLNPSLRSLMGLRGRQAVESQYNWSRDRDMLLEVVERVGRRK